MVPNPLVAVIVPLELILPEAVMWEFALKLLFALIIVELTSKTSSSPANKDIVSGPTW